MISVVLVPEGTVHLRLSLADLFRNNSELVSYKMNEDILKKHCNNMLVLNKVWISLEMNIFRWLSRKVFKRSFGDTQD